MRVNLHMHSTCSDGTLKPKELIQKLYEDEVKICALTDHDTIEGLIEAKKEAIAKNIHFINGIEISTKIYDIKTDFLNPIEHTIHMLGLNFNYHKLLELYEILEAKKIKQLKALNLQLINLGFNIPQLHNLTKKTQIAEQLVLNNYAKNNQEAFDKIVNLYYDRWSDTIGVSKAVEMIHKAGGKLIWAHPYEILKDCSKQTLNEKQIEIVANQLKEKNVDGIEVYYEKYNKEQADFLKKIQKNYNFIASAGTDYHGKDSQLNTFVDIDIELIREVLE